MFLQRKSYLPTLSTQVVMGERLTFSSRSQTTARNFSFVNYSDPNSCIAAVHEMHRSSIDGFTLLVNHGSVTERWIFAEWEAILIFSFFSA